MLKCKISLELSLRILYVAQIKLQYLLQYFIIPNTFDEHFTEK